MKVSRSIHGVAVLAAVLAAPAGATDVPLNPRATYLHTYADGAYDTEAIVLASVGVTAGQTIRLEVIGDWDNGPGGDTFVSTCAVFSSSPMLHSGAQSHRVPGAIAAGTPVVTANTFYCNQPTDIPEDFRVASTAPATFVVITVPPGATHLFVNACDHFFQDNVDPDGDFAIRITVEALPVEPTTWGRVKSLYRLD